MNGTDVFALLPFIVLSLTICVLLMAIAFARNFVSACVISATGLILTLLSILAVLDLAPRAVTPLIRIDGYGLIFSSLIVVASLAVTLFAFDYFRRRDRLQEEVYVLLLSSALGGLVLACSTHFAAFILGLELLGVSLYAMISYPTKGMLSLEAALKYLILSGVSSAFILFGIALLYAISGTLDFAELARFEFSTSDNPLMLMAAIAMVMAGIMFKLSLVPFHMWTPDVYEGAPAPVTAFVATVSKTAIFAVLLRFLSQTAFYEIEAVVAGLSVVAILSMLGGNLLALLSKNVKRVLAYSSIAHLGYLLVALIAGGLAGGTPLAIESCTFFLIAYVVTTLGAFGVVSAISVDSPDRDVDDIAQYEGLFWRRPAMATVFSAMLLSLAGIPLTVGFIGKFYVFVAGVESGLWLLVATLIVGSGIGLYYYLRIIFAMTRKLEGEGLGREAPVPATSHVVMVALTVCLLVLGVYPTPVIDVITIMISSLT